MLQLLAGEPPAQGALRPLQCLLKAQPHLLTGFRQQHRISMLRQLHSLKDDYDPIVCFHHSDRSICPLSGTRRSHPSRYAPRNRREGICILSQTFFPFDSEKYGENLGFCIRFFDQSLGLPRFCRTDLCRRKSARIYADRRRQHNNSSGYHGNHGNHGNNHNIWRNQRNPIR